jgi:xylulokinase
MSLICFTNGSLAREKIKEKCNVDWETFDTLSTDTDNPEYHLILPYFDAESTPLQLQCGPHYNFDQTAEPANKLIRALLESQALSMKLHTSWLKDSVRKIRLTGGASACKGFRQIIADVFQADVETISVSNSAGLGAAFRAANSAGNIPFATLAEIFCSAAETVHPNPDMAKHYQTALMKYKEFESAR